jgi:hypothetical protein
MGAVDTTYTFTATDTITSAKMNNIIDQTTITTDAIIGTTLDVASGKLKIRSAGITSNELGASSVVTDAITDANVTQAKLAANVVGNGPVFRAYASTTTTVPTATFTKVNLVSETFDSNSNFSSSRFTPSVAGYYMICGLVSYGTGTDGALAVIRKNGSDESYGCPQVAGSIRSNVSDIVYLNGSSDYVELFAYHTAGANRTIVNNSVQTYFSGCLIRSA